ncbi:MAG: DoxX-like family protein [Chitinophagales bacterium]|nr:DoxX-like family protein [Chitinophagales bacterium]
MLSAVKIYRVFNVLIACVWFANGLLCKVLHLVPRHEQIVARILGETYAHPLTVLIGCSEVVMGLWVLSGYKSKFNAIVQIVIVLSMNILEFCMAADLLLWGKLNAFFALLFALFVYCVAFYWKTQPSKKI